MIMKHPQDGSSEGISTLLLAAAPVRPAVLVGAVRRAAAAVEGRQEDGVGARVGRVLLRAQDGHCGGAGGHTHGGGA